MYVCMYVCMMILSVVGKEIDCGLVCLYINSILLDE